jgi:hypothetical protein
MRKSLWVATVIIFLPALSWCRQSDTKTDPKQQQQAVHGAQGPQSAAAAGANSQDQDKSAASQTSASSPNSTTPQPITEDSLAAAARKTRDQKKESGKTGKVFTNDNIPTTGGVSTLSLASAEPATTGAAATAPAAADEKAWREKFADLHHKMDQDKQNLEVMQRELGILDMQYYNDPVKAMQQQYSREDINKKTAAIDAKKKEIESDQQAIDDAEDALRKAGGDPGWAR